MHFLCVQHSQRNSGKVEEGARTEVLVETAPGAAAAAPAAKNPAVSVKMTLLDAAAQQGKPPASGTRITVLILHQRVHVNTGHAMQERKRASNEEAGIAHAAAPGTAGGSQNQVRQFYSADSKVRVLLYMLLTRSLLHGRTALQQTLRRPPRTYREHCRPWQGRATPLRQPGCHGNAGSRTNGAPATLLVEVLVSPLAPLPPEAAPPFRRRRRPTLPLACAPAFKGARCYETYIYTYRPSHMHHCRNPPLQQQVCA